MVCLSGWGTEGEKKLGKGDESQIQHGSAQGDNSSRQFEVLPYMKGVTERIQRAFKKYEIRLYSKAGNVIRNAVVIPKDLRDM